MDEVGFIVEELEKRIKVFIIWNDCYEKNENDLISDSCSFSFRSHRVMIEKPFYSGFSKFSPLREQTNNLKKKIQDEAWKILEEIQALGVGVTGVSDQYFDVASEMISHKLKNDRFFVAPDRWLPTILK